MLQEIQPKLIERCECGAELWDGDDIRYPLWCGGDPDCPHEPANDPELQEIENELDEIISRINKSTALIHYYGGLNEQIR